VGEWLVQPELGRISRDGKHVPLQPQVMDLLVFLAHHPGEVVTAEVLMENLWPGKVVTSSSIYVTIKQLRDALGDDPHRARYIKTIPKRGYRLIAKVENGPKHGDVAMAPVRAVRWKSKARAFAAAVIVMLVVGWLTLSRDPEPVTGPAPGNDEPVTLAVMPFEGQDRAFATGLQDHLTTRLAAMDSLRMIARGSVDSIAKTAPTPAEAGRRLGADVLIGGQVQQAGGQWRIQVQLLDVDSNVLLWGTTFDRVIISVERFAIQSEISDTIIAAVQKELAIDSDPDFVALPTPDLEAYEQFLIGQRNGAGQRPSTAAFVRGGESGTTHHPGEVGDRPGAGTGFRARGSPYRVGALDLDQRT
jgi:DNA-binding winged helix-turn-helix (wHTH) protein/TolB-like protein